MKKTLLFAFLFPLTMMAQGYTSYFTGNTTNITTTTTPGTCLMGGATEHDRAMQWLLERANGGDVVVLRSSGSDGYNDYLYSELGVEVNSVETLVITSAAGATNEYVLDKVANAEMIWFAGGDQWNYVQYFKDNALEDLINDHINVKQAPIGGTSAGMAILGGKYFSAQNGSVTSSQALTNPYHNNVTLGYDDFIETPFLTDVITDTHYDNPDRRGRQTSFIARFLDDMGMNVKGIACNEYVAVCIDENGRASVYGDYPNYEEFAFFIQANCEYEDEGVETCEPGTPLTWNHNGEAVKVYKVPGTMDGSHYFELADWTTGSGGEWEHWSAVNSAFAANEGTAAEGCLLGTDEVTKRAVIASPNPFSDHININMEANVEIADISGKTIFTANNIFSVNTSGFASGLYFLKIEKEERVTVIKMLKE